MFYSESLEINGFNTPKLKQQPKQTFYSFVIFLMSVF